MLDGLGKYTIVLLMQNRNQSVTNLVSLDYLKLKKIREKNCEGTKIFKLEITQNHSLKL